MEAYNRLTERLYPIVKSEYLRRFRAYEKNKKGIKGNQSRAKLMQLELPMYSSVKRLEKEVVKRRRRLQGM